MIHASGSTPPFDRELCGPDEALADFMMHEYLIGPTAPTLRPVNLLYCLLEESAHRAAWREIVERLRSALGPNRTVWGAKFGERGLEFELYFYCYERTGAESIFRLLDPEMFGRVREALRGVLDVEVPEFPDVKMIMFSVDVDDEILRRGTIDTYHLYVGGGCSYDVTRDGPRHMNVYEFFEMSEPGQDQSIDLWIRAHMLHGHAARHAWAAPIERYRASCRRFWLGIKPLRDAVYFNQIPSTKLVEFLQQWQWPARALREVEGHAALYQDVRWDAGLDFRMVDGALRWERSAIYGVL